MVVPLAQVTDSVSINAGTLANAAVVLIVAYLVSRTLSVALTAIADKLNAYRFRVTLLIPLLKFLIYGGAVYLIVRILFELTSTQLVAVSGLLGAAIGLGLKDLLADLVGGVILVLEQPYQVGDKVSLGDHYGEIADIGLRSTSLVTPNDSLVVVPNFVFLNESISNANDGAAQMLVAIEFYVGVDADVDRARRIIEEALITSQYVYVTDDHPVSVIVEDDLYYRTITGRAYVNELRDEYPFITDVSERVLDEFAEAGIESPRVPSGGIEEPPD